MTALVGFDPAVQGHAAPDRPGTLLVLAALRRPRNLIVLAAGLAIAAVGGVALGLPLAAVGALGVGSSLYAALVGRDLCDAGFGRSVFGPLGAPFRPSVAPDQIEAADLSAAYLVILRAHGSIRAAMHASQGIADGMRDVYLRCGQLVEAAGRVARSGDALQHYLDSQSSPTLEMEVSRLEGLTVAAHDPDAASAYRHAAQARRHQLDIYRQIEDLYDRVNARLAVVTAFLATVEAMVVKLHALDFDQFHDQGAAISDQVDELRAEIEVLESSLEQALIENP